MPSEAISRNRLILTTKLTGQLFPALRYEYLTEDATRAYQKITCCVARSALEEACASVSSMCNSSLHSNVADRQVVSVKAARNSFSSQSRIVHTNYL